MAVGRQLSSAELSATARMSNKPKQTTTHYTAASATSSSSTAMIAKPSAKRHLGSPQRTSPSAPSSPSKPSQKKQRRSKQTREAERSKLFNLLDEHHPPLALASSSFEGKIPSAAQLLSKTRKQDIKKIRSGVIQSFTTEPSFDNAAFFLIRDGWLSDEDCAIVAQLDPEFEALAKSVPLLKKVDFTPVLEPIPNYAEVSEIHADRVVQLSALAVHFGLDFGLVVRCLGNEYTGAHRDIDKLRDKIGPYVRPDDMKQIVRMLSMGCPAEMDYELPREHKLRMLRRGNQKSVSENPVEVTKTMMKEYKHSHIVPFLTFLCRFAHRAQHVPQGMVIKEGKSPRIVWDGSTKLLPDDIVMNDIVPTENESNITFGRTKDDYAAHIYNTRVSYESADIDLSSADIKAAHRYPRLFPDMAAAFGFIIRGMYFFITTAMVFGSIISATSWEPFRRAIEVMTEVYSLRFDLVEKHQAYLDLIIIEPPAPPGTKFTKAVKCEINQGVLDENGNQKPLPNFIYVDDCLLASVRKYTLGFLAAVIEAIFAVLGEPDVSKRQCPLALDKWIGMSVGHRITLIGLVWDSRQLTVGMTREYLDQILDILNTDWPEDAEFFELRSIVILAGKLARLAEAASWVFHLMPHIYSSIAYALRSHETFLLGECNTFIDLIKKIKNLRFFPSENDDVDHLNFYIRKAAKRKFRSSLQYEVNKTLMDELNILRAWLHPASGVLWQSPLAFIIKKTAYATSAGDSCCFGGGGFSLGFNFWWHLTWPKKVLKRTKLYVENNKKGRLISINVLEFISVIINYAAAYTALQLDGCVDPHPVLLNLCDNKSAIRWTIRFCKDSLPGRALGRLFCMLLVNSNLGINSKWISTHENDIADAISRLKLTNEQQSFDYSTLKQHFPELATCRTFHPSQELLSIIYQCVLTLKTPTLQQITELKQNGLGKLSS